MIIASYYETIYIHTIVQMVYLYCCTFVYCSSRVESFFQPVLFFTHVNAGLSGLFLFFMLDAYALIGLTKILNRV